MEILPEAMARAYSMAPYLRSHSFLDTVAAPVALRSSAFRRAALLSPPGSRVRRQLLLRFFAWGYGAFNRHGEIPSSMLTPNIELEQTGALIDTAGTFRGREGVAAALRELSDAFDQLQFVPRDAVELGPDRLLFLVEFSGIGRGSGIEFARTVGHLFDVDLANGQAKRWEVYWETEDALEAAGLGE